VIYEQSGDDAWIRVISAIDTGGSADTIIGNQLDAAASDAIFARLDTISRIEVGVPHTQLR